MSSIDNKKKYIRNLNKKLDEVILNSMKLIEQDEIQLIGLKAHNDCVSIAEKIK